MHFPELTARDWVLIVAVTCQATLFTYVRHPIWKAFLLSLPIPFTVAMLALGHPLDVTNFAGFGLLLVFYPIVRVAYSKWRWPIVVAILVALCVYLILAYSLCTVLPRDKALFWIVAIVVFAAAWRQFALSPRQAEAGYKSPMPVWLKLPAIAAVTLGLVLVKSYMQGFTTSFPMVGLIAAYEGRFILSTICRQIPLLVMLMFPMMLTISFFQVYIGFTWALIPAWIVYLLIMVPVMTKQRQNYALDKA